MRNFRGGTVVGRARVRWWAAALLLGVSAGGWGETPPAPAPAAEQTVRALTRLSEQMAALQAEMRELRQEVSAARRESQALREQLHELRPPLQPTAAPAAIIRPAALQIPLELAPTPAELASATAEPSASQRLDRLEEEQAFTAAQVATLHQERVQSGSKYRVRLSGMALLNTFAARGQVENLDVPETAQPREPGAGNSAFGATMRQSIIGLDITGPSVAGGKSSGNLQFDFAGGFAPFENGVASGLARLRTGKFQIDWERFTLLAGQEAPLFSMRSPSSLSSMAVPALSYFGNIWTWISQVRAEYRLPAGGGSRVLLQGGILDPLSGEDPEDPGYLDPGAGQKSGHPAWQSRIGWESRDRRAAFGLGSYFSRQRWSAEHTVNGWALTGDWQVPLGRRFELSGELYRGQALAGLGGGENHSIIVEKLPGGESIFGLHSSGGWAQIKFLATPRLELNWAFGENVPLAADLRRRTLERELEPEQDERVVGRNASSFVNAIFKLRSNLVLSGEFRRLWTSFPGADTARANHVSLSAGVLF